MMDPFLALLVFLILALVALGFLLFQVFRLKKRAAQLDGDLQNQRTKYETDISQRLKHADALEAENRRLAKWQTVADADAKATELLQSASATLEKATSRAAHVMTETKQRAEGMIADAQNSAASISTEAKRQAKSLKDEAQATMVSATSRASEIVDAANKRAEEIAGNAYKALENASLYERTVKAMKNIIEGYGDRYIVPGRSLLDDLAEDFGYVQAGQELKTAREQTKIMIRNGSAATCDYVEANRRDTAINFVIDAFNGKVDSILSRAKNDNAGTLQQEIRDAFALVNLNGKAFREARITEEYLSSRLEELRWAAIAQQLRLEEREEQRRIREQIREEEKARKEFERAIRDAAKEEEVLRKAMEKAQQQVEQASAEQKAKYEQKLNELAQRLNDAEARSQRALSMAQQTKQGHVYIISNIGSFGENAYKIGLTRRLEPLDRIRELGDSSVPFEFDVHALLFSEDAPALETRLHKHFVLRQMNKVNYRKEFFRVDLKAIREEIEKMGISAKWTMTAEAAEYRESLAIEKAIAENPAQREAWVKRQLTLESAPMDPIESAEETA